MKNENFKIGQEIFIIEQDLIITPKKILAIINEEKEIKYKLDTYSCNGISEKEIFKTKIKAEIIKQEFLNNLKFIVGDLLIFRDNLYQSKTIVIGQLKKIKYAKKPYVIESTNNIIYDQDDNSIILKIKNKYIENYGRLYELGTILNKTIKECEEITKLMNLEYDQLEKDLKQKFKRQFSYSWPLKKKKPLFKDRFNYDNYDLDE